MQTKCNCCNMPKEDFARISIEIVDKKRDLEKRIALLQAKRSDLHRASLEKDTCSVKVRDVCFPKTSLKIKELRTVVTNQYKHVRFYDDPKTGEIVAGSF